MYIYMGLRQNSGMDRPAVIQTYGTVWITCVLVWIGGMDRPVGSGYGSGLYILTRSHLFWAIVNGTLERNLLINIQHNEERNFLISQKLTKYCLFMYGIFDLLCQQKP